jgi:hypothetical protein
LPHQFSQFEQRLGVAELTAVVRSRQLHIYRHGKKVLVLAGKSAPKIVRQDNICEILVM